MIIFLIVVISLIAMGLRSGGSRSGGRLITYDTGDGKRESLLDQIK